MQEGAIIPVTATPKNLNLSAFLFTIDQVHLNKIQSN